MECSPLIVQRPHLGALPSSIPCSCVHAAIACWRLAPISVDCLLRRRCSLSLIVQACCCRYASLPDCNSDMMSSDYDAHCTRCHRQFGTVNKGYHMNVFALTSSWTKVLDINCHLHREDHPKKTKAPVRKSEAAPIRKSEGAPARKIRRGRRAPQAVDDAPAVVAYHGCGHLL